MLANTFVQVAKSVNPNRMRPVDHLGVGMLATIRRPDCNVVGFHTVVVEPFLHRDADAAATAPETGQEVRPGEAIVSR